MTDLTKFQRYVFEIYNLPWEEIERDANMLNIQSLSEKEKEFLLDTLSLIEKVRQAVEEVYKVRLDIECTRELDDISKLEEEKEEMETYMKWYKEEMESNL
jgi:hypothetical protein